MQLPAFQEFWQSNQASAITIIMSTSCLATAYNYVHNLMIKSLGAVTCSVVGEVKILALVFLSGIFLGEAKQYTLAQAFGCATALAGLVLYSSAKRETEKIKSA